MAKAGAATLPVPSLALLPSNQNPHHFLLSSTFYLHSNSGILQKKPPRQCQFISKSQTNSITFGSELKPKPKPTFQGQEDYNDVSLDICEKIRKLCRQEKFQEALDIFQLMQHRGIEVDIDTYGHLLQGCIVTKSLEDGRRVHAHMFESGVESDISLSTKLLILYAKCGKMSDARQVFDEMPERNLVAWNAVTAGYAQHSQSEQALELFYQMRTDGVEVDKYTFSTVLRACAKVAVIEAGAQVHACIVKSDFHKNVYVESALVDMYAKCGSIEAARQAFDKMSTRNAVSWNAMIAGYVLHGFGEEALSLFYEMQMAGVKVDQFTLSTVVRVCVCLASLEQAKQVHAGVVRCGYDLDVVLESAFVDLYSKWGRVEDARRVFDKMPERNVISWNAMIAGYGNHGRGKEAIHLFEQMQQEHIKPNHVTFLALLSACSYSGLLDEGCRYFQCMSRDYGIVPRAMHYARLVELYSRAGRLNDAYDVIDNLPFKPTANILGALLCACRMHENIELGTYAAEHLIELEPQQVRNYVVLLNVYTAANRLENGAKVRRMLEDRGMKLEPSCSWIDIKKRLHVFCVGDRSHAETEKIYAKLDELTCQIKEAGYVPHANFVLPDVMEEEARLVSYHSEKLAIAFGLISTLPTSSFQVVQNHRICADCHTAAKLISKIVGREILVRDASRFHRFNGGRCSCGDYW